MHSKDWFGHAVCSNIGVARFYQLGRVHRREDGWAKRKVILRIKEDDMLHNDPVRYPCYSP